MDLLSSPDPLNESVQASGAPSSARRVTRSQVSQRFFSLANSPRKQTFELDVGNEISPQKILVTVEAEENEKDHVSRRLFTSPAPQKRIIRRREKSTTTQVPLKGLTDDEDGAIREATTPKRRGRPTRSGTPTASSRRRASTPARGTPRQTRREGAGQDDIPTSETSIDPDATPKTKTAGRKAAKRKAPTPARNDASSQSSQPRKRGRPRRKSLAPEELLELVDQQDPAPAELEDVAFVTASEENMLVASDIAPLIAEAEDLMEEDIWMATLSEPPTPVVARRRRRSNQARTSIASQDDTEMSAAANLPESEFEYPQSDANMDLGGGGADTDPRSRDQDTIMEGEGFTMISINSVPSLQENMSASAEELPEIGDATSFIINQTLESLRQAQTNNDGNPSAAGEDQDVGKQSTSVDIDESNNPKLAHQAMTSQPTSLPTRSKSPRRARAQDLARQVALRSLQKRDPLSHWPAVDEPGSVARSTASHSLLPSSAEDASVYEDSFSEIPEAVLDAATPRPVSQQRVEVNMIMTQDAQDSASHSSIQTRQPSEPLRMLTPEETPSPSDASDTESKRSAVLSVIRSSPPALSIQSENAQKPAPRHSRQTSAETPVVRPSSAELSRPVGHDDARQASLAPSDTGSRPTLSPIVRIGRSLQLVMSDPPSPPDRGSVLGSPFRASSSVGRRSESPKTSQMRSTPSGTTELVAASSNAPPSVHQPQRSWAQAFAPLSQIRNLVIQGVQVLSPRATAEAPMEDPFRADIQQTEAQASEDSLERSLRSRVERSASLSSSTRADPPSDDEMSWEVDVDQGIAAERPGSAGSSIFATRGSSGAQEFPAPDVDDSGETWQRRREEGHAEEEEDDIWAIEAQRPTPTVNKVQKQQEPAPEPPRRSKLPGTWRQNSKRLTYNDELHRLFLGDGQSKKPHQDGAQEYSLLSQTDRRDADLGLHGPVQSLQGPEKKNLSAFFSSPAVVPAAQPPTLRSYNLRKTRLSDDVGGGRNLIDERRTQQHQPVPQKSFRPNNGSSVDLFSPVRRDTDGQEPIVDHSSSPVTPEKPSFAPIPQKRDFTPRSKQAGNSLFNLNSTHGTNSLFTQPSRSTLPDEAADDENNSSTLSQESSFEAGPLKPLPDKAMSPTKSCIRSPLKAKTPGRVVEFASSALSPLAQVQARVERRVFNTTNGSVVGKTTIAPPFNAAEDMEVDKENHGQDQDQDEDQDAGVAKTTRTSLAPAKMMSNSPSKTLSLLRQPRSPRSPPPLSQTQWSRAHWLRLDELLQERRASGALQFQLRYLATASQMRAGASGIGSAALLGKRVTSQGESMRLERWHLDVVDAFGVEVGGWDEGVLAKRLFSLLVGEERRRTGRLSRR